MPIILILLFLLPSLCFGAVNIPSTGSGLIDCGTSDNEFPEPNNTFTYSAWIFPTTDTVNTGDPRILVRRFSFEVSSLSTLLIDFGDTGEVIASDNSLTLNTWNHIMLIWDGSITAANVHMYVNNSEVSYQVQTNAGSVASNSTFNMYMGNRSDGTRPFSGLIQDVAWWNVALTSAERTQVYNGGKQGNNLSNVQPGALKGWWRLNECADGVVCSGSNQFTDISATANHCTAGGSPLGKASKYSQVTGGTLYGSTIY